MPFLCFWKVYHFCLTLFRLSTLLWIGSCTHCILACFRWSKRPNVLHQTMVYTVSIHVDPDTYYLIFWYALKCYPNPYLCLYLQSSKVFVIAILYCFLSYRSFSFLILNISPSILCYLFTYCQAITNISTTRLWSVSQSAPQKLVHQIYSNVTIYQYVINLFLSLPVRRSPDLLMNVSVQEHFVLSNQKFCGKV
jgi:hypothetical protein